LEMVLFVCYDHVDIIRRTEAVVHGAEQAVRVRWQVNANNLRRLVHNDGKEARIL
jgi:hypothetical protein